jgi:hypothetical protein
MMQSALTMTQMIERAEHIFQRNKWYRELKVASIDLLTSK